MTHLRIHFHRRLKNMKRMMFLPLISLIGLFILAGSGIAEGDAAPLNISLADTSELISGTPGKREISVKITGSLPTDGSLLHGELRQYDSQGTVSDKVAATDQTPLAADSENAPIKLTFNVVNVGLFTLKLTVSSPQGEKHAHLENTLAAVPDRKEVGPSDWGVNTHFGQGRDPVRTLPLIKLAGFSHIRDEIGWSAVEPTPGNYQIPKFADYVDQAHQIGISPLICLDYGNPQAYPQLFSKTVFPDTADKQDLYCKYASTVVTRFKDEIKDWEIWNEPNAPIIPVKTYAALEKDVYKTIKEIDPSAVVISCGGGGPGGGPYANYFSGVVIFGGYDIQDGFSIHPYMSPCDPDFGYMGGAIQQGGANQRVCIPAVWKFLQAYLDAHPKSDGSKVQLWVTEIGWPITDKQDDWKQAAYFARTFLLSRIGKTAQAVFWYDFQNDGIDPKNPEHNFGFIRQDYSPKISYQTAAILSTTLGNRQFAKTWINNDPEVNVSEFSGGLIAGWAAGPVAKSVKLPLPMGTYVLRDWSGVESQIVVMGDEGYTWNLGMMPQYILPQTAR